MKPNFLLLASVTGALAVLTGALGAHALKPLLAEARLDALETAVRYQFYHSLALLAVHLLDPAGTRKDLRRAGTLFLAGMICFCGSIYLLATRELTGLSAGFLGPVTPLGGLLFIAGWLQLAVYAVTIRKEA